jgi:sugar lactone lactonase YvrE
MFQPCLPVSTQLGEGPHWDPDAQVLWFVDIIGQAVHRYNPTTRDDVCFVVDDFVSTVVPRARGGLVITRGRGFYRYDWATQELHRIAEVEPDRPNNRFNDGKCDARGRFWAGTLDRDEREPKGALYCLEVDGTIRKVLDGITVSNGIGFSPDQRTFYYIDSPTHRVVAFDYDLDHGTLSNRRELLIIDDGVPDGMTVDAEGMLWIGHWDGGCISRWDPKGGTCLARYRLPVDRVTSVAFGGPDLSTLFITTARHGLTPAALKSQPLAGQLFAFEAPVAGLPAAPYGG